MTSPSTPPPEYSTDLQESSTLSSAFNILVSTALLLQHPLAARLPAPTIPDSMPPPSLIACLESYINPALPIGTGIGTDSNVPALHLLASTTLSKLKNVGPARIKDMRALGQARQILSHVPIAATPATCTRFNDTLASVVQINRDKFAALAVLPMEGREAAKELQRCVVKMKFVGGVLGLKQDGCGGLTMGNDLEEVWSVAARYHVPVMVRDMWPLGTHLPAYQAGLADSVVAPLVTNLHTSHNHSPLPILHLYLSGVFDRHPDLRLILAHPCLLPSLLPRIDTILALIPAADKPSRGFLDVWQHNFYLTTADVLDMSTMRTLLEQIPVDRVLYASNYPLEQRSRELMDELRESKFLTKDEWERLAWGNAEFVFGFRKEKEGKAKAHSSVYSELQAQ